MSRQRFIGPFDSAAIKAVATLFIIGLHRSPVAEDGHSVPQLAGAQHRAGTSLELVCEGVNVVGNPQRAPSEERYDLR